MYEAQDSIQCRTLVTKKKVISHLVSQHRGALEAVERVSRSKRMIFSMKLLIRIANRLITDTHNYLAIYCLNAACILVRTVHESKFYVYGSVHHNIFYEITNRCSYMQSILFHC